MPKYLTSSTLWYSGIFAAAATFDAGVKKERREQWDKAIAEVKEDLGQSDSVRKDEILHMSEEAPRGSLVETIRFKPLDALAEDQDVFQKVDPRRPKAQWPANTGPALSVHHLPPESIYATEERKGRGEKTRWSPKKLATVQVSFEMLQLKLFLELQKRGWSQEAANAVPEGYATHVLQDRAELIRRYEVNSENFDRIREAEPSLSDYQARGDDTTLCRFKQDDLGQFHRTARELNLSLRRIFQLQSRKQIRTPALLGKLSYNLSISSAPPNIGTYNTLLLGLSKLQEPRLVSRVITSMCETHMRLNEVSLVAMLNHYTKANQAEEFIRCIERMRGKHGGLAMARPDILINEAGKSRLLRKPDEPWKVIQLPYPTPDVFGAVISGVIKFADFETALGICQNMGLEGWGLCMGGLTPLLQDCAERRDWASGMAVWKQIQALKAKSRKREGSRWISERIGLNTFAAMLRLCSTCSQRQVFDDIWSQAWKVHRNETEKLVGLVKGRRGLGAETDTQRENQFHDEGAAELEYGSVVSSADESFTRSCDATDQASVATAPDEKPVANHRVQSRAASNMLNGLQAASDEMRHKHEPAKLDDSPRSSSKPGNNHISASYVTKTYRPNMVPVAPAQVLEEQLFGTLPLDHELENYELRERPMTIYG